MSYLKVFCKDCRNNSFCTKVERSNVNCITCKSYEESKRKKREMKLGVGKW